MGYLAAECLKCGFQFNIPAEDVETKCEMFCPNCSLRMDDRLWRKARTNFFLMEEVMDHLKAPVMEIRLFQTTYRVGTADSAKP